MSDIKHEKKIVFVGMPDMALVCLNRLFRDKFNIVAVIPPHKSNPSSQTIKIYAEAMGLNVYEFENSPNENEFVEKIKNLEADIGVVCSYDILLSKDFLNTTREGYINCHPSILPEYRGANPYHHIIRNMEEKSGITLHMMNESFDTGDIIYQREFLLDEKETMGTLFNNCNYMFADALADILKAYEEKGELQGTPQKQGEFKRAPKVANEIILDLNLPVKELDCMIRASNPFYTCNTFFRAIPWRIILADYAEENHDKPIGQIASHKGTFAITVNGGYLYPRVTQLATWGFFDTEAFIKRFNPQIGEKVGL